MDRGAWWALHSSTKTFAVHLKLYLVIVAFHLCIITYKICSLEIFLERITKEVNGVFKIKSFFLRLIDLENELMVACRRNEGKE